MFFPNCGQRLSEGDLEQSSFVQMGMVLIEFGPICID